MKNQEPTGYDEASDALLFLAHDLGFSDDGGPLAKTLAHLLHLPPDRMQAIVTAAYQLSGLLDTSLDTHADTGTISYMLRKYGREEIATMREDGCSACAEDMPNWQAGVCRVCSETAYATDGYYCSEDHRLQDVRERR